MRSENKDIDKKKHEKIQLIITLPITLLMTGCINQREESDEASFFSIKGAVNLLDNSLFRQQKNSIRTNI